MTPVKYECGNRYFDNYEKNGKLWNRKNWLSNIHLWLPNNNKEHAFNQPNPELLKLVTIIFFFTLFVAFKNTYSFGDTVHTSTKSCRIWSQYNRSPTHNKFLSLLNKEPYNNVYIVTFIHQLHNESCHNFNFIMNRFHQPGQYKFRYTLKQALVYRC